MTTIERFVEKVLTEEGQFSLEKEGMYASFFQDKVGAARYVFARYDYRENDVTGLTDLTLMPELVAIVANNLVYIVNVAFFEVYWGERLPLISNVVYFGDICANAQQQVQDEIFPVLFNQLDFDEITDENELEHCRRKAREIILYNEDFVELNKCDIKISKNQVAQVLCGFTTVKEITVNMFGEHERYYKSQKAKLETIKKLVQSPDIAEDWERKLADGVKSVEAKAVTVEFTMNGKTEAAKVEPFRLLNNLVEKDYFSAYNFVTAIRGDDLIKKLGAATFRFANSNEPVLTCEHITKVTYGKRVLFEREI